MRHWLIRRLGGYTQDDVFADVVKDLYNTIGANDILQEKDGAWYFEGKQLPDGIAKGISSEASTFLKTSLWRVMQADVKYQANKAMFEKAQTKDDILAGKLWLFLQDCYKTRLESLAMGRGTFNSDALKRAK